MLDHDARSYEDIARAFEGDPVGNLTRDEVLDNITLTWVTNTGVSSGRLYWENTLGFFDVKGVSVPAAVSVFPRELYQAPRSWAEQAYPNLIYFNELDDHRRTDLTSAPVEPVPRLPPPPARVIDILRRGTLTIGRRAEAMRLRHDHNRRREQLDARWNVVHRLREGEQSAGAGGHDAGTV
jgi:hypothetical protein